MSAASQNKKSQKSEQQNSTTQKQYYHLNPENLNQDQEMGKKNKRRNNAQSSAETENAKEQENDLVATDSMMHMSQMTE